MSNPAHNIFDEDGSKPRSEVAMIPVANELGRSVKRASDLPPRPKPGKIEEQEPAEEWTPATDKSNGGQQAVVKTLGFVKTSIFTLFVLGALGGVGYAIYWIISQYNV